MLTRTSVSGRRLSTRLRARQNILFSMETCKSDKSGLMIGRAITSIIRAFLRTATRSNLYGLYAVRPGSSTLVCRAAARPSAEALSSWSFYRFSYEAGCQAPRLPCVPLPGRPSSNGLKGSSGQTAQCCQPRVDTVAAR